MSITYAGKLYAKLAEVVAEVEGVAKSGTNDFHRYKYTTAEEMLRALRGPLADRKVVLLPSVREIAEREIRTAKGGVSTITTVRVAFTLADGETGETCVCEWAGQGDDPADKGLGKAYTNAIKTFLREQFLIPQGDDPEADERTDRRAAERIAGPTVSVNGGAVTSRPAQATERTATAKQRGLINGKAGEKGLPPIDVANIVLAATESPVRDFESQSDAEAWLRRAMDRLPARAVDAVLAEIEQADPVEAEL